MMSNLLGAMASVTCLLPRIDPLSWSMLVLSNTVHNFVELAVRFH